MIDMTATLRTTIELESPEQRGYRVALHGVLVDADATLSWLPATVLHELGIAPKKLWHFRQADGTELARSTGYAIVHVAGTQTSDEIVFGEPGDVVLLGARSLGGLNLRVEPATKRLVDAGPAPAAVSFRSSP
jgi:hypothetical protein